LLDTQALLDYIFLSLKKIILIIFWKNLQPDCIFLYHPLQWGFMDVRNSVYNGEYSVKSVKKQIALKKISTMWYMEA